jgi:hypothetical protein
MISSGTHTPSLRPLDVEALADARRQAPVADHRQPEGGVGRGQHGRQRGRRPQVQPGQQGQPGHGAGDDGERQADAEQAGRDQRLAPQPAQVDPDGITEQHQGEGRLGQVADELAGRVGLDQPQRPVAGHQPDGHEHHGLGDGCGRQPPRHRRIADQHQCDPGQGPSVHASSEVGTGSSLLAGRATDLTRQG